MNKPMVCQAESLPATKPLLYVVDDEAMLLELATLILESAGYEVKTFRDPLQALEAYKTAHPRPALVLTDYAMHSMNGITLIEKFRQIEPGQKTALISGTIGTDIVHAAAAKPNRFLAKPYNAAELVDLVESALAD